MKLPLTAYAGADPVAAARFFLGKQLVVETPQGLCAGIITETEAYGGAEDRACHGFNNRLTPRTQMLFQPGGVAYVYLCYGIHYLLNFVTGPAGNPMATLIRAVQITQGKEIVAVRRPGIPEKEWASGPGRLTTALGINKTDNGLSLLGDRLWVEDIGITPHKKEIEITPRIGVDYALEWAAKPWRFVWHRAAK